MTAITIPTLDETVERMKREIIHDVALGAPGLKPIPVDLRSFEQLHDYRDANEYGGFCDDELFEALWAHFNAQGCPDGNNDGNAGMPDAMIDYMNKAQRRVSEWIASGGMRADLERARKGA